MKKVEVVAGIIKDGDKIFVTRRDYGDFENLWEFPGGKIEVGESKEEALIREIKEELELYIKVSELLITVEYDYQTFHLVMDCYLCNVCGGVLQLNAHNDARWVHISELDTLSWVPADILVVEKIKGL